LSAYAPAPSSDSADAISGKLTHCKRERRLDSDPLILKIVLFFETVSAMIQVIVAAAAAATGSAWATVDGLRKT